MAWNHCFLKSWNYLANSQKTNTGFSDHQHSLFFLFIDIAILNVRDLEISIKYCFKTFINELRLILHKLEFSGDHWTRHYLYTTFSDTIKENCKSSVWITEWYVYLRIAYALLYHSVTLNITEFYFWGSFEQNIRQIRCIQM